VVGSSSDELITVREFAETAKHYKAQLEIIEGGSHDLMLDDDFEKSAALIHQWIDKQ
jgi:alpha-beta hydrolase superfamily lysophospholipase